MAGLVEATTQTTETVGRQRLGIHTQTGTSVEASAGSKWTDKVDDTGSWKARVRAFSYGYEYCIMMLLGYEARRLWHASSI